MMLVVRKVSAQPGSNKQLLQGSSVCSKEVIGHDQSRGGPDGGQELDAAAWLSLPACSLTSTWWISAGFSVGTYLAAHNHHLVRTVWGWKHSRASSVNA